MQEIPAQLRPAAEAALVWLNEQEGREYELTGLVDYEEALTAGAESGFELGLVVCDGEICAREQIRVDPTEGGFEFGLGQRDQRDIPPLLDPPEGVRQTWLDGELAKHEFVVLLFYRGLW